MYSFKLGFYSRNIQLYVGAFSRNIQLYVLVFFGCKYFFLEAFGLKTDAHTYVQVLVQAYNGYLFKPYTVSVNANLCLG